MKRNLSHRLAEAIDAVEKLAPSVLILIGIGLMLFVIAGFSGSGLQELSSLVDVILKLSAIAVIGLLLPRLASLEVGGWKLSVSDGAKNLAEVVNKLSDRVRLLEEAAAAAEPAPEAESRRPDVKLFDEPKLPQPRSRNDPQKNRFGGRPSADGYRLSASFPSENPKGSTVQVHLRVDREDGRPLAGPVKFWLHDTFRPDTYEIEPSPDGDAHLELLVWGGFTVGAWPRETQRTLLELDLAEIPGAPRVIREF